MNNRRFYFKTVLAIIIVILCFTGYHTYSHLKIQAMTYTDNWSRGIEIGTGEFNRQPLMSTFDNKLFMLTFLDFSDGGKINYYLVEKDGSIINQGIADIDVFNKNSIDSVYLVKNNVFFVKDSTLFMTSYNKDIFNEPKELLTGITGFNLIEIEDKTFMQVFNEDSINLYTYQDEQLVLQKSYDNKWNIKSIYYRLIDGKEYIFVLNEVDKLNDQILGGTINELDNGSLKVLDSISYMSNTYIHKIYVENVEDKIFLIYPTTKIETGGFRNEYVDIQIADISSMEVNTRKRIGEDGIEGINNLGREKFIFKYGNTLKLIAAAENVDNMYSDYRNIFILDIGTNGSISKPIFLTNTENTSKVATVFNIQSDQYIAWLDNNNDGYKLMLNSTNEDFKLKNFKFTESDYKSAILKALSSPLYAVAGTVLKIFWAVVFITAVFLPLGLIVRKLRIEDDRIKFALFILAYVILNLITFKGTYYSGTGRAYVPDLLKTGIFAFFVPLLVNFISGIIIYIFYREKKNVHYVGLLAFFIILDLYLANLLYIPFTMMSSILV
ncbi:hypothetical protein [Brassicibacter mesophilus]|uniref:hypothetical protein n=1 Tax=Brassicibacter mesophilus TaxID=745119 RepID=UPI003D205E58